MNGNEWKKNLWDFFAAAVGFWINKEGVSTKEKTLVGAVVLMVVILTVFM
jgi:hypothetical protein